MVSVQRVQWVATDLGDILPAHGPQLGRLLGSYIPSTELTEYAIRNLGFAGIAIGTTALRITLRPKCLSDAAVVALGYWLADRPSLRVLCNLIDDPVEHRMFGAPTDFLRYAFALVDRDSRPRDLDFKKQCRHVQTLDIESPIRKLLRIWQLTPSMDLTDAFVRFCNTVVSGRMTIVEPVGDKAELITRHIGDGYKVYDRRWLRLAVGRRYEDGPDPYYGRWVADAQRTVLQHKAPAIDDIDAFIDRPFKGKLRVRYTRVVLPFQLEGRRPWLLTASTLAPDIDLRVRV